MKIAIIIPHWNGKKILTDCLKSLEKIYCKEFIIIVVDNGSSDNSVEMVREDFKEVGVIENKKNLGFASACNIGIKSAMTEGYEYFLLLNNDTVVSKDFLDKMINTTKKEDTGIVGCRINYYNSNKVWFAGADYVKWRVSGKHRYQGRTQDNIGEVVESDYITGCCMLIKKEVVEKIGYFYEPYFLLIEDLDFCLRARRAGFKIKVNLGAVIHHKVSFSRAGENSFSDGYYGTRNRLILAFNREKNYLGGLILLFIIIPVKIIKSVFLLNFNYVKGIFLGIKDFLNNPTLRKVDSDLT